MTAGGRDGGNRPGWYGSGGHRDMLRIFRPVFVVNSAAACSIAAATGAGFLELGDTVLSVLVGAAGVSLVAAAMAEWGPEDD
ncbi:MAG: hypothetical protein MPL62_12435 [Alphaproteobacteria bacterium]|nr:hypothetical protein [Alphaproteobacteria bacterium]